MASTQNKGDSKAPVDTKSEQQPATTDQKTTAALEEDDEFEDFPVDGTVNLIKHFLFMTMCSAVSYEERQNADADEAAAEEGKASTSATPSSSSKAEEDGTAADEAEGSNSDTTIKPIPAPKKDKLKKD